MRAPSSSSSSSSSRFSNLFLSMYISIYINAITIINIDSAILLTPLQLFSCNVVSGLKQFDIIQKYLYNEISLFLGKRKELVILTKLLTAIYTGKKIGNKYR